MAARFVELGQSKINQPVPNKRNVKPMKKNGIGLEGNNKSDSDHENASQGQNGIFKDWRYDSERIHYQYKSYDAGGDFSSLYRSQRKELQRVSFINKFFLSFYRKEY